MAEAARRVTNGCIQVVTKFRLGCAWPNQTGGTFGRRVRRNPKAALGTGDVEGVLEGGIHFEVEIKIGPDQLKPAQVAHKKAIEEWGALYFVVKSVDDFVEQLRRYLAR